MKKNKKYIVPNIKYHNVNLLDFVMITASKQSFNFDYWKYDDFEGVDYISNGRTDYGFNSWDNSDPASLSSGRKSYEVEEW